MSLFNDANDAGATQIIFPSGHIVPGVHPVTVGIRNFGTNVINGVNVTFTNIIGSAINFSTNPLIIHWSTTGPVISSGPITINTGTLVPATELKVGTQV